MEEFLSNKEKFLVKEVPRHVYYVPNFITEDEENGIICNIYAAPKPKWTQLLNRRLQNWGGLPHHKGMIAEQMPKWLATYVNKIDSLQLMNGNSPNHVLINEYHSGQGIMPHVDGSLFYPTITTITCGSHTVIHFKKDGEKSLENKLEEKPVFSLLLERRSLLVVQEEMYHNFLHHIEEITSDEVTASLKNLNLCSRNYSLGENLERGTRISLTIRHVPKTSKIKIKL